MPKKKAKRKVYFGQEVQDAIIEYNLSESNNDRNIIYQKPYEFYIDKFHFLLLN